MYFMSTRSSEGAREHNCTGDLPGTLLESRGDRMGSCGGRYTFLPREHAAKERQSTRKVKFLMMKDVIVGFGSC